MPTEGINRWFTVQSNALQCHFDVQSFWREKAMIRDGQNHHLLVILKIKIRSSKKWDFQDQDQIIKIMWSWRSRSDHDLDLQDHNLILKIKIVPISDYHNLFFQYYFLEIFFTTGNLLMVSKNRVLLSIGCPKLANIPLLTKLICEWFSPQVSRLGTAVLVRTCPVCTPANAYYFFQFRLHSVWKPWSQCGSHEAMNRSVVEWIERLLRKR